MTTVVHPGDSLTRRQRFVYVIILGALTALGPFTIDLYLPAFPAVQRELFTTEAVVQLTLTATTIGFALGQLIVGPLSDRVGRRLPLLIATALHIAASVAIVLAPDVVWVGIFRLVQGIGAAGGAVVAMAMVRDLFGGLPLVRMLSRLALVSGLAPIIAPFIGSQLLRFVDWRGIFVFLGSYGIIVFVLAVVFLVETLPPARRAELGHSSMRERYRSLFSDRIFVGTIIIGGMTFTGLFSYLSSSPFLFQGVYDFSAQEYGLLFGINSLGIVAGVQISSRIVRFFGPQWILLSASTGMLVSATAILVLDLAGAGLIGVLVPLWFFIMSCGFAFPMQQVLALNNHGAEAATAASLMGAVNFGVAGLVSPIVGLFGVQNAIPMSALMMTTSVIGITVMLLVVRPRTVPALSR